MGEFFKGWRRKTGCVALAFACVLTLGWVRSYYFLDSVNIQRSASLHAIESGWGAITWTRISPHPIRVGAPTNWSSTKTESLTRNGTWDYCDVIWSCDFGDFHFGVATRKPGFTPPGFSPMRIGIWAIHYWSLVIPLTLLSAYLLLSKPRTPAPKTTIEPKAAEGT